jgi:ankyrin repeat protein
MNSLETGLLTDILKPLGEDAYKTLLSLIPEAIESNRGDNTYWKSRVEQLLQSIDPTPRDSPSLANQTKSLKYRHIGWRSVYERFKEAIENGTTDLNKLLILMAQMGHVNEVSVLIEFGANPAADNNLAIILAVDNDRIDVVKLLLKNRRVDPSANNNQAYKISTKNGFHRITALLEENPKVQQTT